MKKKLIGYCLIPIVFVSGLATLLFVLPPSSWQSSGLRVRRCFDLDFRISNDVPTSKIRSAILVKFPIGTPQPDVELFLKNKSSFFKKSSRNYIKHSISTDDPSKHEIKCSFPGGGILEFVFHEFSIFFIFDNKSNLLTDVIVVFGLTGF